MNHTDKNKQEEKDLIEELQEEITEIENEEGQIDEEKLEEAQNPEEYKCKDMLAKVSADFDNFKKRVDRDRDDMIFFLKNDIFKKILPRIDDLDRIIKNTPEELKENALYEGVVSMQNKFLSDLEKMGVKSFVSIGEKVNPDMHDVMTMVPGKEEGIIFDEFEKGFMLGDRVLRHAKVIVGAGL
ncbi:MAG: nucleotide exchange factor GrpE [Candidatus Gracilibacteria bacterium]|nr:nucleotide exchange factor GrpE [Candidatus Gracilibacteria bacterium]